MNTSKMNSTKVKTIDDLPDLPFQRVLSYLSLQDCLKSRAVSRGWYNRINCYKVKSLCCSELPRGFIWGKGRLIRGAFAQNFISSPRFTSFFNMFASTSLSNLKHLQLCDVSFSAESLLAFFQTLNSFVRLEVLNIFGFGQCPASNELEIDVELNLPTLNSIHLEVVDGVKKLTLNTPRLKKVVFVDSDASVDLNFVHGESVEKLTLLNGRGYTAIKNLKNLKYLHIGEHFEMDSTLLSHLEQLKELHFQNNNRDHIWQAFVQKRRYDRTDLNFYRLGLLLNGPEDPEINAPSHHLKERTLVHLAENPARLADEIPLCESLPCEAIQRVAPGLVVKLLNRFTDLNTIRVNKPIQDVQRFLNLLKNFENIIRLEFFCDQPQKLFNRLPEHCAVQWLTILRTHPDLRFLFRLKHLTHLKLYCPMSLEFVRKVREKLPFLYYFHFLYANKGIEIETDLLSSIYPKPLKVSVDGKKTLEVRSKTIASDLDAAIQFIVRNTGRQEEDLN